MRIQNIVLCLYFCVVAGAGIMHRLGGSGASHGGTGGRGACGSGYLSCFNRRGLPYGDIYWPTDFGSGGSGTNAGSGRLHFYKKKYKILFQLVGNT